MAYDHMSMSLINLIIPPGQKRSPLRSSRSNKITFNEIDAHVHWDRNVKRAPEQPHCHRSPPPSSILNADSEDENREIPPLSLGREVVKRNSLDYSNCLEVYQYYPSRPPAYSSIDLNDPFQYPRVDLTSAASCSLGNHLYRFNEKQRQQAYDSEALDREHHDGGRGKGRKDQGCQSWSEFFASLFMSFSGLYCFASGRSPYRNSTGKGESRR